MLAGEIRGAAVGAIVRGNIFLWNQGVAAALTEPMLIAVNCMAFGADSHGAVFLIEIQSANFS